VIRFRVLKYLLNPDEVMFIKYGQTSLFILFLSIGLFASPNTVQSSVVVFPVNGRVIVQARNEVGKFPRMTFISEKTGKILHTSSIEDKNKWLIPLAEMMPEVRPQLKFRVIRSTSFQSPMIMSVGVSHGGSDDAFYLTIFGEINGKICRLNNDPLFTLIQGGYYLGYLNKQFGYGLAVWRFIWGNGANEWHYSEHKYEIEIYQLQGQILKQKLKKVSRKMYDADKGSLSLREIGIKGFNQRKGIPNIKEFLR
jgi:hypothetical protein